MKAIALKSTYDFSLTYEQILNIVKKFTISDKIALEKELEKETLIARAKMVSLKVKPNTISMDEIVNEIKQVRKWRNVK